MTDTTKPGDPADKQADGAFGGVTSHRAGYGDKLARVEEWLRRHPSATLASGEGAVLLAEIDRLRKDSHDAREELGKLLAQKLALRKELENLRGEIRVKHSDWELEHAEVVKLRAAIERVRALHERETRTSRFGSIVWHLCPQCRDDGGDPLEHPCPTLRALDEEAA